MWKYRKEIIASLSLSVIILLYTLFISNSLDKKIACYDFILSDYTFMFIFSIAIFYLFYEPYNYELTVWRFKKFEEYFLFEIKKTLISLAVFFLILTFCQIVIFTIYDSLFSLTLLIYQNIIFFWLYIIFYLIILFGKRKNYVCKVIIMFIIWNILYIIYLLFPENLINQITVFKLLKGPNMYEILRLVILSLIIVYGLYLKIKAIGRKELE